jgi:hypothetical protein
MMQAVWTCLAAFLGLILLLAGAAVRQFSSAGSVGLDLTVVGLCLGLAAGGYLFYLAWRLYLADRSERRVGYTTLNRGDRVPDCWYLDGVTGEVKRRPVSASTS